ncbi:MAG TPA: response regulator transcription factor [Phycisphaerales bacterium]|nr:response regulator transcription factor [Phycisphaerales bacterium]
MPTTQIRIMIVDDHAVLRSGLRLLIDAQPDMRVVGEAGTLHQAAEAAKSLTPDVITLDLSMPGPHGLAGIERLRTASPASKVLVLTMHEDASLVRSALAMGAVGYVVKSVADSELITAIRAVASGRLFVDSGNPNEPAPRERPAPTSGPPVDSLSEREREVLIAIAKGFTNQQVADKLHLSVKTVESYRARLMKKLNLGNRADLVRLALEMGVLRDPVQGG